NSGFLGVRLPPAPWQDMEASDGDVGLVIWDRIPGFCGYRMLQTGDVVVAIGVADQPDQPIRTTQDLTSTIGRLPADTTVRLQINRGGEMIQIEVTLQARPEWASGRVPNGQVPLNLIDSEIQRDRVERAEEFWEQTFGPLVDPDLS